jgi:hypothetical protein
MPGPTIMMYQTDFLNLEFGLPGKTFCKNDSNTLNVCTKISHFIR